MFVVTSLNCLRVLFYWPLCLELIQDLPSRSSHFQRLCPISAKLFPFIVWLSSLPCIYAWSQSCIVSIPDLELHQWILTFPNVLKTFMSIHLVNICSMKIFTLWVKTLLRNRLFNLARDVEEIKGDYARVTSTYSLQFGTVRVKRLYANTLSDNRSWVEQLEWVSCVIISIKHSFSEEYSCNRLLHQNLVAERLTY